MAVNRYTQIRPTDFQYQSTIVPMPFSDIAAVGEVKQKQYDTGKALTDQLGTLESAIKAAPGHEQWKAEKLKEYNNVLQSTVDKFSQDFASPEFQRETSKIINQFKNDPEIQQIQGSYNWYEKQYLPYKSDPKAQRDIDLTLPQGQNKTPYSKLNIVQYKDPIADASKIMDNIAKDTKAFEGYDKDLTTKQLKISKDGYLFKNGVKTSELAENKVFDIAMSNIGNFAKTEGGYYALANALKERGINPVGVQYEQLPAQLKAEIGSELGGIMYDLGKKQIFKSVETTQDIKEPIKKEDDGTGIPVYEIPEQQEVKNPTSIDFSSTKPSKTGLIKGAGMGEHAAQAAENIMGLQQPIRQTSSEPLYNKLKKEDRPIFDKVAKSMFPNAKPEDLKSNETLAAVENYMNKIGTLITATPINTSPYEGTKGETLQKADQEKIKRNYDTRVFYDLDENKALEGTSDEIKELIGNEKTKVEVVGEYSPKNYFSTLSAKPALEGSPLRVRITDEEGNAKIYAVSKPFTKQNPVDKDINKVFTETSTLPGVPKEFEINGKKVNITFDPQNEAYIVEGLENPVKNLDNFVNYLYSIK